MLFEDHEESVKLLRIDGIVGQVFVDLTVRQVALFLGRVDECLETFVFFQIHSPSSMSDLEVGNTFDGTWVSGVCQGHFLTRPIFLNPADKNYRQLLPRAKNELHAALSVVGV